MKNKNKKELELVSQYIKDSYNSESLFFKQYAEAKLTKDYYSFDNPFSVKITLGKAFTDLHIPDFNLDDIYMCGYMHINPASSSVIPNYRYIIFKPNNIEPFNKWFQRFSEIPSGTLRQDAVAEIKIATDEIAFTGYDVMIDSCHDDIIILSADYIDVYDRN